MLKIFKNSIQYESSKIVNYVFVSQKLVDEKMKRMAKKYETIDADIIKLNVGGTYFSTLKSLYQ